MKKIYKDALVIKQLINRGMNQSQISKLIGLKLQKVNYWAIRPISEKKEKKNWANFIVKKNKRIKYNLKVEF